ncbi:hypothetical protein MUN88_17130 [Gracilibacillus caseinilyticus]|uniref:Uncharacterized protein n=1 Tax=Gracilibacillus caseinilyticus TaxID=2932256 RepID=A0ABY4EZZ8_9BACI|nr:hypothetical protein [Gracilibacillus caseinilyticus]UOQ47756.1 hypothetical protein MUN88_17130 [Gracilibacillus caseinilyticus]
MDENEDVLLILKFVEKQFLESTLDGNLYFSRCGNFIDLEKEQQKKGIGDAREGSWSRNMEEGSKITLTPESGESFDFIVKQGSLHESFDGLRNIPICCFVMLSLNNDFAEQNNIYTLKSEIANSLYEQFKDRKLIGFDAPELFDRLDSTLKKSDIPFDRKPVNYYDEMNYPHPISRENYTKAPFKALFYKRKFFEF